MITTVHTSNTSAIQAISHMYGDIECDVTYNRGAFWKKVGYYPRYKFDIMPLLSNTVCADVRQLPVKSGSLISIMFDPPFLAGTTTGVMQDRFSAFENMTALKDTYEKALTELYRVLSKNGYLAFKCQDIVNGKKQHWIHVDVINYAESVGFYVRDMFILHRKNIMKGVWDTQQHARRTHCYFIVLQKGRKIDAKKYAVVENKQMQLRF